MPAAVTPVSRRRAAPSPAPIGATSVTAGPISALFSGGDMRYLRLPATELVRRIYFVARAPNRRNVPHRIHSLSTSERAPSFDLSHQATSTGALRLAWECHLRGDANGTVTFSVNGRALHDARVNRAGLCKTQHLSVTGVPAGWTLAAPHRVRRGLVELSLPPWGIATFEAPTDTAVTPHRRTGSS